MKRSLVMLVTWAAVSIPALGEPDEPSYRIRATLEMVAITPETAVRLLPRLNDAGQLAAALLEVDALVKSGAAEMVQRLGVVGQPGVRVQVEGHDEFRYPTEFEPLELPGTFESIDVKPNLGGPFTPHSFETRNLGGTLEFEPTTTDGDLLKLNVLARLTMFDRWAEYRGAADAAGVTGRIMQPQVFNYRAECSFHLRSGGRVLLGSTYGAKPKPSWILFLFSATTTHVAETPPER